MGDGGRASSAHKRWQIREIRSAEYYEHFELTIPVRSLKWDLK